MADFQLEWSIEGEKQLSRMLIGMENDLKDLTQPFSDSADYLKQTFSRDVFNTQGAAIGRKWKRLSPATVAAKARQGFSGGPLVRTGKMQNSFQSVVSSDRAVIHNTAEYFKYHQSNQARSSRLPRRVVMALGNNQKAEIVRVFQRYIQATIRSN